MSIPTRFANFRLDMFTPPVTVTGNDDVANHHRPEEKSVKRRGIGGPRWRSLLPTVPHPLP